MSLLPEQQAANHISKLLDAANEAGLFVPRSVNSEQCRRFILSEVQLDKVLEIDSGTIDRSISHWIYVRKQGQRWAPWHLGAVLAEERDAGIEARRAEQRKPGTTCPIKPQMVQSDGEKDYLWAQEHIRSDSHEQKKKTLAWAHERTGRTDLTFMRAYLVLARYEREKKA